MVLKGLQEKLQFLLLTSKMLTELPELQTKNYKETVAFWPCNVSRPSYHTMIQYINY